MTYYLLTRHSKTMLSYNSESEFCMRILNNASNTSCRNLTISSPSTFINASRLPLRTSGWLAQFNSPSKSTIKEGTNIYRCFSFCNRARFLIYILKNQIFALKYTLKHSLIKIISTSTCFGLIRPSSGSCHAWLLSYLEQITFVLGWLCSSMHLESGYC